MEDNRRITKFHGIQIADTRVDKLLVDIANGDENPGVSEKAFENLVKVVPTDLVFNNEGKIVLMHDSEVITKQTPLDLGEIKGPISVVDVTAKPEATNGQLTEAQLVILQKSNMNMIMFNHEVYTLMDKGHTEGFLTYTHVGIENDLIYIKTFTITVNNRTWVLNIRSVPEMIYNADTKTLTITE